MPPLHYVDVMNDRGQGDNGAKGNTGASGINGAKGDKGARGSAGANGSNGTPGVSVLLTRCKLIRVRIHRHCWIQGYFWRQGILWLVVLRQHRYSDLHVQDRRESKETMLVMVRTASRARPVRLAEPCVPRPERHRSARSRWRQGCQGKQGMERIQGSSRCVEFPLCARLSDSPAGANGVNGAKGDNGEFGTVCA